MIAIDASSLQRLFRGDDGADVVMFGVAIRRGEAFLPGVVVTEALSNVHAKPAFRDLVTSLPVLSIHHGYWYRVADLRRDLLSRNLKANLADTLIAQSCIDHDIPLITYDRDFRNFVRAGLMLA